MKKAWTYGLLGSAVAGLLTVLLFIGNVPVERYATVLRQIVELKEADARLTLRVLETRLGLAWNYDGIVQEAARLRTLMQRVVHEERQLHASGGDRSAGEAVHAQLQRLVEAVENKLVQVERFKSHNAVLRSALRYLPEASLALVTAAARDTDLEARTRDDLVGAVEHATKQVLQLMAENGPPPSDLDSSLIRLRETADTIESLLSDELDRFVQLATLVVQLKPQVDHLVDRIKREPVETHADSLYGSYAAQRDALIVAVHRYRWMLFVAALALLIYLTVVLVRLRVTSARLRTTLADTRFQQFALDQHAIVVVLDPDGGITYANDKFCEAVRMPRASVLGHRYRAFWPASEAQKFEHMWRTLRNGKVWHGETSIQRVDGGVLWLSATSVPFVDEHGVPNRHVVICTDVSQRKLAEEQLRYQARHDSLTGLLNRRELERHLDIALEKARRRRTRHAMLYVDLDQFKVINDTCGHMAGDEVLRQLSAELGRVVPSTDVVARLGGDEFGILLHDCQAGSALERARAIHQVIGEFRFAWCDQVFQLSASIGVAPITGDTPDVAAILSTADLACSMAKEKGRNRIHLYEPDDRELRQRHNEMQWISRIKQALEEDRLVLYAQRIEPVNAAVRHPRFEALVRMLDERGQAVPPGAFIPAAERYGLMAYLDRWVIDTGLRKLGILHDRLPEAAHPMLSINISGASLGEHDLLDFIRARLRSSGVDPHLVCFEITETAAIGNLKEAGEFLRTVRALGCRVALDDFGSGLSSFTYLKRLPVDALKIDGSFVRDMCHEPLSAAMVEAVTRIARTLDIETIAEFVENEDTLVALREAGVHYAQGYLIHPPSPLDEVMEVGTGGAAARPGRRRIAYH